MNGAPLARGVGALREFIFVRVDYPSPWACECLDGWHITGQALLGYLMVPLTFHNQIEAPH